MELKITYFLKYTHEKNSNQEGALGLTEPLDSFVSQCHIMEPKDVATLKHLSEELQNDREILLHAAALSERDFEGQSFSMLFR